MSTKALAMFFFTLFLLNIPVLMFYAGGVDHSERTDRQLMDYFGIFSLGNVGTPGYTCGEQNLARIEIGRENQLDI